MGSWRARLFIFEREGRHFVSLVPDGVTLAAYKVYGPYVPISEEAALPVDDPFLWIERMKEKGFRFVVDDLASRRPKYANPGR